MVDYDDVYDDDDFEDDHDGVDVEDDADVGDAPVPSPSPSAAPSSGPPAARAASNSLGRRPAAPPERASKRPALDQSGGAPDAASALRHLETLDAASLRDLLRARGIRGAAVDLAGRGALLARARQALGEERSAGGGDGAGDGGGVPRSGFERPSR